MKECNDLQSTYSRRKFLQGAAALTALSALPTLAGCSSNKSSNTTANSTDIKWEKEVDIIAVGAGAAGLSCAIEAAEIGQSILVLESQATVGGSSALCNGGIAMPNTPLQKEQGIDDSAELFYQDLSTMTKEDNNLEFLKKHCELAEGLYEWLTNMGLEFKVESLLPTQGQSVAREHHINPIKVIETLEEKAIANGAEILVKTTANKLIQDTDGRVIGVWAEDSSGKEIALRAKKGVVLATNGYTRNPEMLNKFIFGAGAENIIVFTGGGDTGLGHRMAMEIGADTRHLSWISLLTGQNPDGSAGDSCSLIHGGAIMINKEGNRFVRESKGYGNVWTEVASQIDGMCYQIWDEDIAEEYAENDSALYSMKKLRESGLLIEAPTLDELASKIEVPADILNATVQQYNNDLAATGEDSLFGRSTKVSEVGQAPQIDRSPFYAWKTGNVCYNTTGGILNNVDMQAIHLNGEPISGLYLAGSICTYANMGIVPGTIKAVGASGTGFGGALIWGRYVAQRINELETA